MARAGSTTLASDDTVVIFHSNQTPGGLGTDGPPASEFTITVPEDNPDGVQVAIDPLHTRGATLDWYTLVPGVSNKFFAIRNHATPGITRVSVRRAPGGSGSNPITWGVTGQ